MGCQGKSILIVDDCKDNQLLMKIFLKSQGYEVLSALSGKEGLRKAEKHVPDLILLDMMMPDLSGLEVLRKLKASTLLSDTPVMLCTANLHLDLNQVLQADAVCPKPFNLDYLLTRIEDIINKNLASSRR